MNFDNGRREREREIVSGQLGTPGLAPGGEERYPGFRGCLYRLVRSTS